jgi:DNA helicase-4
MFVGEDIRNSISTYFNFRSTLFWLHQKRELQKYKILFDTIERQPLTNLQRRSVILDERRNLVVAGAGTGKTSVIIAKVGYLLKSSKCRPEDILLLAFNADAASELASRCRERLGVGIRASTFHGLGNQIVASVEPVAPTLSRYATDRQHFRRFLAAVVGELIDDPQTWKKVRTFVLGHIKPYKAESEFRTQAEYVAYCRAVELRALSGDLVKSFAELDIANFLFYNGIRFEYERRYPHGRERYHPDFYLTDYDIWIEHFGIDRNGNTAPFVDREKYHAGMKWKRVTHTNCKTKLLETYSWQKSEGNLTKHLHRMLKEQSVQFVQRSRDEISEALKNTKYTDSLATIIEMFLLHFKSNQMSLSDLRQKLSKASNIARAKAFAELFQLFFKHYQSELDDKRPREIDFNDMISTATHYIKKGKFQVPWKYIIVDEFQDISVGRYMLLDAMLRSRKDLRLFAVGDDWQSIYRFAGSDISIMGRFRHFFGRATIVKLDRTFRFNDKIASVSGRFIQKNPNQIRKSLKTETACSEPQVVLHWIDLDGGNRNAYARAIISLIETLRSTVQKEKPSILTLARYNHLLPDREHITAIAALWPGEVKTPLTIHRSKGLEADYVILIGLTADKFGFPSEIDDDPLLDLVLARADAYPNAEERRLFYVALTRARRQVHILVDRRRPSTFALELMEGNYDVHYAGRGPDAIAAD